MLLRTCILAASMAAFGKAKPCGKGPKHSSSVASRTATPITAPTTVVHATTSSSSASAASSAAASSTSASSSKSATTPAKPNGTAASGKNFEFFGINESGPEFGQTNLPGKEGTDYTWPTLSTIDTFVDAGMNTFRINLMMERLIPNQLTGSLDSAYLASLKSTVKYITDLGAYAMICPHNYGRYYNNIITDTAGFKAWWKTTAAEFADNELVMFDTNNEYHDMDQTLVVELNQAAIDGIRAAGATSQWITPEGNAWTGAWSWTSLSNSGGLSNGQTMGNLTDPSDKLIYQMHQYLDSDDSGTSETCVSTTIGAERLVDATKWLKDNGKKGMIGEFAGGANADCKAAVDGMLKYMVANNDVWTGALWWAAGPWWGTYMYSIEPTSGPAYSYYLKDIASYA